VLSGETLIKYAPTAWENVGTVSAKLKELGAVSDFVGVDGFDGKCPDGATVGWKIEKHKCSELCKVILTQCAHFFK